MGGYVAQLVALNSPAGLVRRLIIAGFGPSAIDGIVNHPAEKEKDVGQLAGQGVADYDNCFYHLFFYQSDSSQGAGRA